MKLLWVGCVHMVPHKQHMIPSYWAIPEKIQTAVWGRDVRGHGISRGQFFKKWNFLG